MKGDHLPGKDHVIRYCPGSKLAEDGTPLGTAYVDNLCHHVKTQTALTIRVLHEPSGKDPAHAGIYDTDQDEMIITDTRTTAWPTPTTSRPTA